MSGGCQKASSGAPLGATEAPRGSYEAVRGSPKSIPFGPKFGGHLRKGYTINHFKLKARRYYIARVIQLRSVGILMFRPENAPRNAPGVRPSYASRGQNINKAKALVAL